MLSPYNIEQLFKFLNNARLALSRVNIGSLIECIAKPVLTILLLFKDEATHKTGKNTPNHLHGSYLWLGGIHCASDFLTLA